MEYDDHHAWQAQEDRRMQEAITHMRAAIAAARARLQRPLRDTTAPGTPPTPRDEAGTAARVGLRGADADPGDPPR